MPICLWSTVDSQARSPFGVLGSGRASSTSGTKDCGVGSITALIANSPDRRSGHGLWRTELKLGM